jgi:hypothetical protein
VSVRALFGTLVAALALGLLAAPSALAYTSSPLGWCAKRGPGPVKVEAASIPGSTSVARDGTGRGTIGVTMRIDGTGFALVVYGPDFRPVGYWSAEFVGCQRTLVKISEIQGVGPRAGLPMKLRKGSLYYVGVQAWHFDDQFRDAGWITWAINQVSSIRGAFLAY